MSSGALYEYTDGSTVKAYNAANAPEYRQFVAKVAAAMRHLQKKRIVPANKHIVLHGEHGARMANNRRARVSAGPNTSSTLPDDDDEQLPVSIQKSDARIRQLLSDDAFQSGAVVIGENSRAYVGELTPDDFASLLEHWDLLRQSRIVLGLVRISFRGRHDDATDRLFEIWKASNFTLHVTLEAWMELSNEHAAHALKHGSTITLHPEGFPLTSFASMLSRHFRPFINCDNLHFVINMTSKFFVETPEHNIRCLLEALRTLRHQYTITLLERPTRTNNTRRLLPPTDPLWKDVVDSNVMIAHPYGRTPLPAEFMEQISAYKDDFQAKMDQHCAVLQKERNAAAGVLDDDVISIIAKALAHADIFRD